MLEIHVPLRLVLVMSGFPILFLIGLIVRIMRMKPWKGDSRVCFNPVEFADRSVTFGIQIERQILEQHIDADGARAALCANRLPPGHITDGSCFGPQDESRASSAQGNPDAGRGVGIR
jgi:hypothetical protein